MMLVVGGDVVDSFTRILPDGSNLWNSSDIRTIITEFGLIVLSREGSNPLNTIQSMPAISEFCDRIIQVKDEVCPSGVSSTRLRAAIMNKKSIKYSTPDEVINFIRENNLYQKI